jgi:hypothetical protein
MAWEISFAEAYRCSRCLLNARSMTSQIGRGNAYLGSIGGDWTTRIAVWNTLSSSTDSNGPWNVINS